MNLKGILIDLDHTIYDYNIAHKAAINAVFDLLEKTQSSRIKNNSFIKTPYNSKQNPPK